MPHLEITVGPAGADILGSDHMAIQSAVDYVFARGGGSVRLLAGTYHMHNSLFLRDRVRVIGAGEETILRKCDGASTPLTENMDWYEETVVVEDPSLFRVGGGIWIEGMSPFHEGRKQIAKRTVVGIEGNVIQLDEALREDFWLEPGAQASTAFPVITAEYVNQATVESLAIDGNREHNPHLDDNYAGAIFIQDCDRMIFLDLTIRDYNSDGISAQICDDLVVEGCRISNCADLGIHPGSGCQRPRMINNTIRGCSQGIFFCWGVRHGLAEGNVIEDSLRYGISIGHRDTDNIVRSNTIRRSGEIGVLFRTDRGAGRSPDRCVLEGNLIEDSGPSGEGVAVDLTGVAEDIIIRHNRLVETRPHVAERRQIGIRIAAGAVRPVVEGNVCEGMDQDLLDQRAN
ncbi:MAG: right-handed parallel beta-helix repeat-containing protein [Bacteroidota bacterium]